MTPCYYDKVKTYNEKVLKMKEDKKETDIKMALIVKILLIILLCAFVFLSIVAIVFMIQNHIGFYEYLSRAFGGI